MMLLRRLLFYALTMFIVGFVVHNGVEIHRLYKEYEIKENKARAYLNSDVCSDKMRHKLDNYNLCDQSEMILSMSPMMRSLTDILSSWHICANSRCHLFYLDITDNILYIVCIFFFFLLLVPPFLRIFLDEGNRNAVIQMYQLPGGNHFHND